MILDQCYLGDCRDVMRQLIAEGVKVQCIVTSPPYWGLRDYGVAGQIGLEPTLREYVDTMVEVFDLAREVLADDGTLWLNLGDSYGRGARVNNPSDATRGKTGNTGQVSAVQAAAYGAGAVQPNKQLLGIPWRVAFALQDAGWYLRQDIIWHKPNPMPESVTDRCTKAHEYLFLLAKAERYFWNAEAMRERALASNPHDHTGGFMAGQVPGAPPQTGTRKAGNKSHKYVTAYEDDDSEQHRTKAGLMKVADKEWFGRNRRSVWTVATTPYSGAHFATFPPALVEPCILAGSRPGDIVFDPFMGSGTVAQVAQRLGRRWIGAELNPEYIKLQAARTRQKGLELIA